MPKQSASDIEGLARDLIRWRENFEPDDALRAAVYALLAISARLEVLTLVIREFVIVDAEPL